MGLSKRIMGLFGWKATGSIPEDLKKFVVVAAPHTSAWDFPLGVLARSAMGRDIKFIGKKSLFRPPFGWIMRKLGGYPVDRKKSQNFVDSIVAVYDAHEEFAIALAPEGTRKKVNRFRTGFYYIAKGAGIPIILVRFDYDRKVIEFHPEPFWPTDDSDQDLKMIWDHFKGVRGKIAEYSIT